MNYMYMKIFWLLTNKQTNKQIIYFIYNLMQNCKQYPCILNAV